jgi:hypothetical protein
MFNTAKNTIKKAAKDQVEFFLVLLTGLFSGSIFTLAYVKFWEEGDVTFSDIGGMLAGVSTLGLFVIAVKTAKTWKKQNLHQLKLEFANELSAVVIKYFSAVSSIVQELGKTHSIENFEHTRLNSIALFNMINKVSDIQNDLEAILIRYEIIVKKAIPEDLTIDDSFIKTINTYIELKTDDEYEFLEIQKMHNKLKEQAIFSLRQTYKELIKF